MRSKAEEYRHNAVKCLSVAEMISDLTTRAGLLAMERNLAVQAERNSQVDLVYETPEPQAHVAQQQQIQPDQDREKNEHGKKSE